MTHKAQFIYIPPKNNDGECKAQNATMSVKFANRRVILDEWYLMGGTKWTRFIFRLKHPIVYSKRGIAKVYRKIKGLFIKENSVQCWRLGGEVKTIKEKNK